MPDLSQPQDVSRSPRPHPGGPVTPTDTDDDNEPPFCARCGSSMDWQECGECEDGYSHHDCGEDCCCCLDPEPNVRCDTCNGAGGWWHCLASPDWCDGNPLKGREHVQRSTRSDLFREAP